MIELGYLVSGLALLFSLHAFITHTRLRRIERRSAGPVHVNKVEITVSSNQAPGQIARKVVDQIQNLRRSQRVSPPT